MCSDLAVAPRRGVSSDAADERLPMRAAYASRENGPALRMATCTAAIMFDVRKAKRGLLGSFHRRSWNQTQPQPPFSGVHANSLCGRHTADGARWHSLLQRGHTSLHRVCPRVRSGRVLSCSILAIWSHVAGTWAGPPHLVHLLRQQWWHGSVGCRPFHIVTVGHRYSGHMCTWGSTSATDAAATDWSCRCAAA